MRLDCSHIVLQTDYVKLRTGTLGSEVGLMFVHLRIQVGLALAV